MPENGKMSVTTISARCKCGAQIERSRHLVKSKKVSFSCGACDQKYHREYSLRAYYQKKALREAVEARRVVTVRWGERVTAIAALA
jgi:hypothetical protein